MSDDQRERRARSQGRGVRKPQSAPHKSGPHKSGRPEPKSPHKEPQKVTRRPVPQGLEVPDDEPTLPDDFDDKALPRAVKAELRSLPKEMARTVAGHLLAAMELIDDDPALAHRHAKAARRRASRLPVVRELAGEAAYAAEDYAAAINDFRTVRRMTGNDDYLPVIADCERALGRPKEALALARESESAELSPDQRIEMRIVEAGAREDLGELAEARRVLKAAITDRRGPREGHARLRMAYAELLVRTGHADDARQWFQAASRLDADDELRVGQRIAELDGVPYDVDESDDDGFDLIEVEEDRP